MERKQKLIYVLSCFALGVLLTCGVWLCVGGGHSGIASTPEDKLPGTSIVPSKKLQETAALAESAVQDNNTNDVLSYAVSAGMELVIPPKKNRKEQRDYNKYLYKLRYLVKNCFLSLKRWRGFATRYAKTSDAFIVAVHVRCTAIWAIIYF